MYKNIDFSNLKTVNYGNGKRIDWKNSVGMTIPFTYSSINGELKIIEYQQGNYVIIEFMGKRKRLRTSKITNFKFKELFYKKERRLQNIDFSEIQKKYNRYDWKNSKGSRIYFDFYGIQGELLIEDYIVINGMGYLIVKYKNNNYKIRNINLLNGKIASIIGYGKFNYNIGDRISDNRKDITIIDCKKGTTLNSKIVRKRYKYHCNICNNEDWIDESSLGISTIICNNCTSKIAIPGKNDIATEAPWMTKFFSKKDKHLIYECRKNSNKKIYPVCPNCKEIRKIPMAIGTIYSRKSISCPNCSDYISYPEKFVSELFRQLNVKLVLHLSSKNLSWGKNFIYDFYDENRKVIIEVNGMHHYEEVRHYNRSLKEVIRSDNDKYELALKKGINCNNYIVLDCRYSKLNYIKQSILNNEKLRNIYSFKEEDIDWEKCELNTSNSFYFEIYKYKLSHPNCTYYELGKIFNVNRCTVGKAINKYRSLK